MSREHDPNSTPGRRALASQLKTALEARTLQRSVCRVTIGYTVGGTLTSLPRRLALRSDVATPIQITAKRSANHRCASGHGASPRRFPSTLSQAIPQTGTRAIHTVGVSVINDSANTLWRPLIVPKSTPKHPPWAGDVSGSANLTSRSYLTR